MKSFSENILTVVGLAPNADLWAGNDVNTDVVDMRDWRNVHFEITEGTGTTGATVVTMQACDDIVPTNTTDIAFRYRVNTSVGVKGAWVSATTAGFTTTVGGDQLIDIEVASNELTSGKPYIRLHAEESVDAATDAGVNIHLFNGRYPQSTHADVTD